MYWPPALMKKLLLLLFVSSLPLWAALTTVSDTIYNADGTTWNGTLTITWPTFTSADGHANFSSRIYVPIVNGVLNKALEPNDTGVPTGTSYYVSYLPAPGQPNMSPEVWVIPTSASLVSLAAVRVASAPTLGVVVVGGGGAVFAGATAVTSSFSTTPIFNLASVSNKSPVRFEPGAMTANVTAVTFANATAGAKFSIIWLQDATGGRTVTYGGSTVNTCWGTTGGAANKNVIQLMEVAADGITVTGAGCISNDVNDGPITASSTTTFTNKTYDTAGTGNSFKVAGTALTAIEGNSSKIQMFTGADPATNDCAKFDANHNLVGNGSACAGGSTASGPWWYLGVTGISFASIGHAANTPRYVRVVAPYSMSVSKFNNYVNATDTGHKWGIAIYDSGCNRLTASTSTGGSLEATGAASVNLGGGSITLSAGTVYYVAFASDGTTSQWGHTNSQTGLGQFFSATETGASSAYFNGGNAISVASGTITWPATCGTRTIDTSHEMIAGVFLP